MNPAVNVLILAAGKGTRMHSERPKVLHRLAGRPLLAHVLASARALAPRQITVVYGYGGEAVPAAIPDPDVVWVRQAQQLGTGHAVASSLDMLSDAPVTLILYGDVPLIQPPTATMLAGLAAANRIALLTEQLSDPTGYGRIVRDDAGAITRIVEHKDATPDEREIHEVNTGLMALPTARLADWVGRLTADNAQGEYYLTDIVALALADGVEIVSGRAQAAWETLGVNSHAQLAHLERIYQRRQAEQLLEHGVALLDPDRLDVRGELICGRDVTIDVGCVFEGAVTLGDNTFVGAYTVLRNTRVGANTRIEPFSHLDETSLGEGNRIGPFARLRPGAATGASVHVGNFVEVKNSRVGEGSKINHLSYVGDADVGVGVNIGAGTITCNYDGARKHRTVIGDDAFIGSNTQLVAPVTVGPGATIGAGSTITRDAPAGELTLSRARQTTISGWKRPRKGP
ncbi:MAG: bifunctional UDP-N-acetylglucosamine diphosphorylase/glucosamine-1-phosphate N-acetyltransferase GlmU [Betaproteobacteria bacterium]|nr:bifunctional UDP-N-acetylglucosamine diphosphorylase/glucosamine-1-phosphate N-acetyltransferase GlmU [Betaproteobacteria bacterium]